MHGAAFKLQWMQLKMTFLPPKLSEDILGVMSQHWQDFDDNDADVSAGGSVTWKAICNM